jgi:hypothetical protein
MHLNLLSGTKARKQNIQRLAQILKLPADELEEQLEDTTE